MADEHDTSGDGSVDSDEPVEGQESAEDNGSGGNGEQVEHGESARSDDPGPSDEPDGRDARGGDDGRTGRDDSVGICVSGGGVRAASFGLGALQALQDEEKLVYGPRPAGFLAAVSGGSYIAGAITMLANAYEDGEVPLHERRSDGDEGREPAYPFAPDTPEVEYVRRHVRYLLGGGMVEAALQLTGRLLLNLLFVAAAIYLIARPLGWAYGWGIADLGAADDLSPRDVDVRRVEWLTWVGSVVTALGLIAFLWTTVRRQAFSNDNLLKYGRYLLYGGVVALLLGVVVPEWLGWVADEWVTNEQTDPGSVPKNVPAWTLGSVVAAVAAGVTSLKTLLPEGVGSSALSRRARPLLARVARGVAALVATVAVPVGVVAFATMMLVAGALNVWWDDGTNWRELGLLGVAVLVLGVLWGLRDPAIWSLHPFYKKRLMSCFCVRRVDAHHASERPYGTKHWLTQSSDRLPKLLVCAAANVRGFGDTPGGHDVLPFVFSPDEVGFTSVGGKRFETAKLQTALEGTSAARGAARNITLPASIAISGSAVSPSMGKMTIPPVRTLLALLNLRLGVWLPNPANPKVWGTVDSEQPLRPAIAPLYLLKEAFGWNRIGDPLVYVSDGGHYENLGLVELLRKRCRRIWCIDAAGDRPGQISTLTEAMLLAESELGVRWTDTEELTLLGLDEESQEDPAKPPRVVQTHATFSFRFKDDAPADDVGSVTIVRLGITSSSPRHLVDYQRRRPTFPYDSTSNQLFRAERFDAYRSLGYDSMKAAVGASRRRTVTAVRRALDQLDAASDAGRPPSV